MPTFQRGIYSLIVLNFRDYKSKQSAAEKIMKNMCFYPPGAQIKRLTTLGLNPTFFFFRFFLTGPRSAKNFRSRIFDGWEMAEKSMFPVGDHFPRPYDAKLLRPGNSQKFDFSSGGPLSETLRC